MLHCILHAPHPHSSALPSPSTSHDLCTALHPAQRQLPAGTKNPCRPCSPSLLFHCMSSPMYTVTPTSTMCTSLPTSLARPTTGPTHMPRPPVPPCPLVGLCPHACPDYPHTPCPAVRPLPAHIPHPPDLLSPLCMPPPAALPPQRTWTWPQTDGQRFCSRPTSGTPIQQMCGQSRQCSAAQCHRHKD